MQSSHQGQISLAKFLFVFVEVIVILSVVWHFGLEQLTGLFQLVPIIAVGFAIHSFLPLRHRPLFFLILSCLGIVVVVPPPNGLAIIGIGAFFILVAHLPIRIWIRAWIMIVVGVLLTFVRMGLLATEWTSLGSLVVPILGSFFMFRMIIYLHDLRHEKDLPPWPQRVSYFFMLPNVCFLLFPVVDYQTYKRKYYDEEASDIYSKGAWWMFRGVTHLLLYRVIYLNFVPSSAEVEGIWGVAHAFVATYLLYLRISGQFHLIAGIMCLFGHNFLETNHLYYLASSASDYWRRINIYWKDFMTKIFYNHAFVWFKKTGVKTAVMLSMVYVFVVTWALHSYQWLWLKGTFPVAPKDIVFWGSFMVLAMSGVYFEMNRPRRKATTVSFSQCLSHSSRVVATFITISFLWSLWSSANLAAFGNLLVKATQSSFVSYVQFVSLIAGIIVFGAAYRYTRFTFVRFRDSADALRNRRLWWYPVTAGIVLLTISISGIESILPETPRAIIASASSGRLNRVDEEILEAGYYETLLEPSDFQKSLWFNNMQRPPGWNKHLIEAGAAYATDDIMVQRLSPSVSVDWRDVKFTTNEWAMRDKSYSKDKKPDVVRVALLGSSKEMGWGIGDNTTFESLIEQQINSDNSDGSTLELLNFSVYGYTEIQNAHLVSTGLLADFNVDAVVLCTHMAWVDKIAETLHRMRRQNISIPYPNLERIAVDAGLGETQRFEARSLEFKSQATEIMDWAFSLIEAEADSLGIPVYLTFVPNINRPPDGRETLQQLAVKHGFKFIDVSDAYEGQDEFDLRVAPWDSHPNQRAHSMIARAMMPHMESMIEDLESDGSVQN